MGHMTEPLHLILGDFAEIRQFRVFVFGQSPSIPDQMGQAGLTQADPFRIEPVAVADQDALPLLLEVEGIL
jgi:hypothetical protein